MKRILVIVGLLMSMNIYSATYTSVGNGLWSVNTNWNPVGVPTASDVVIINSNITYSGNLDMGIAWSSAMNLTINSGKSLVINGNLTELAGTKDNLTNNGTLVINGSFVLNQGQGSGVPQRSYITNNGVINVTGGDFSNSQNTSFYNNGTINFVNSNFTLNAAAVFSNSGIININNTGYSGKTVLFSNLNYSSDVTLNSGSEFNITKSNLSMTGYNGMTINGKINVTDGNITETFGSITIGTNGGINTTDTDASGDGILNLNGGGATITNNGVSFVTSLSTSGGGVTVTDNNMLFVRDMSVGTFDDGNNIINVSSTGKFYYCSNPVRQEMSRGVLGTVASGGKLYYSKEAGSYPSTSPNTNNGAGQPEQDFTVANTDQVDMSTVGFTSCPDAFKNKLSPPLPIELSEFTANRVDRVVLLNWETKSETNNDFFSVLRSFNGTTFEVLDKINGQGTTSISHRYRYIDEEPYSGINYYKIKQTDYDGKYTYSYIKSVDYSIEDIIIFPNPSDGIITIETSLKDYSLKIFNMTGTVVYDDHFTSSGKVEIELEVVSGVYQVVLEFNNKVDRKSVV